MTPHPLHADIAKRAGVSRSTVSRALQDSRLITPETRERIQALAKEMGYRPNPLVSAFAAGRRKTRTSRGLTTLAFLTGWPTADGWHKSSTVTRWFRSATARAESLGYRLDHFWANDPAMTGKRLSRVLHTRGIVGLILVPDPSRPFPVLEWDDFAAASFTTGFPMAPFSRVMNHHSRTMWLALEALRSRRYKRIGFVSPAWNAAEVVRLWTSALLLHQTQHRLVKIPPLLSDPFNADVLLSWVREHRPDAILGYWPQIVDWLGESGFPVPQDIGFLNLDWAPAHPHIAGVDQRHELIGEAAVDAVVAQLHRNERGVPAFAKTILVDGEWVDGSTLRSL